MPADRVFTTAELKKFDGIDLPMYLAYDGVVYDVSESLRWRSGLHEGLHFPAQDLSGEMGEAPHGLEVFQHLGVRVAGRLADPEVST